MKISYIASALLAAVSLVAQPIPRDTKVTSSNSTVTVVFDPLGHIYDLSVATSGGATNGIQQLNGNGTNTAINQLTVINGAHADTNFAYNGFVTNLLTAGGINIAITNSTAATNYVVASGYDTPPTGAANVPTGGSTVYYVNVATKSRIRQDGAVHQVQFYTASKPAQLTHFYFDFYRRSGLNDAFGNFNLDLVSTSADVLGQIVGGQLETVTLADPPQLEGDYIGWHFTASSDPGPFMVWLGGGDTSVKGISYGASVPGGNFDWAVQTTSTNYVPIQALMTAPQMVFIGDSIIQGSPLHNSYITSGTSEQRQSTFPFKTVHRLGMTGQNMGIAGQTSTQISNRFAADLVALKPKFAVLEGGINEIAADGSGTNATYANILYMFEQASNINARIVYVGLPPCLTYPAKTTNVMVSADLINTYIKSLVAATPGALYLDMQALLGQQHPIVSPGNLWDERLDVTSDGIHPNSLGYSVMADWLVGQLAAITIPGQVTMGNAGVQGDIIFSAPFGGTNKLYSTPASVGAQAGSSLALIGGSAYPGSTNQPGGNVALIAGQGTGTNAGGVFFGGSPPNTGPALTNATKIVGALLWAANGAAQWLFGTNALTTTSTAALTVVGGSSDSTSHTISMTRPDDGYTWSLNSASDNFQIQDTTGAGVNPFYIEHAGKNNQLRLLASGAIAAGGTTDLGNGSLWLSGNFLQLGSAADAAAKELSLYAAAGQTRDISIYSASHRVWIWRTSGAEGGANAGANYSLVALDDAGSSLGTAISITRSTLATLLAGATTISGAAQINNTLGVTGTLSVTGGQGILGANHLASSSNWKLNAETNQIKIIEYQAQANDLWDERVTGDTALDGSITGATWQLGRYNDANTRNATAVISANRQNGNVTLGSSLTVTTNIDAATYSIGGTALLSTGGGNVNMTGHLVEGIVDMATNNAANVNSGTINNTNAITTGSLSATTNIATAKATATNQLHLPFATASRVLLNNAQQDATNVVTTAILKGDGTAAAFADWTNTANIFTAGTTKFLREDGTMQTPSGSGGGLANTVLNSAVTSALLAVDSTGTNGTAATSAMVTTALGTTSTPQFARIGIGTAADATHLEEIALGTVTADTHPIDITGTWNNAGVTFTGIKENITSSASAAASLLMDLQLGSASKFSVRKDGLLTTPGAITADGTITTTAGNIRLSWGNNGIIDWGAGSHTPKIWAAGVADTLVLQNTTDAAWLVMLAGFDYGSDSTLASGRSAAANTAAPNLKLQGGLATGTARSGNVDIQTGLGLGASGSTLQVASTRYHASSKYVELTESSATTFETISVGSTNYVGAELVCTVYANDGTDYQSKTSRVMVDAVNKGGTVTSAITQVDNTTATSSGTLSVTYTATTSGANVILQCNAVSSLGQSVLRVKWVVVGLNSNDPATMTDAP